MHRVRRKPPSKRLRGLLKRWRETLAKKLKEVDEHGNSSVISEFWGSRGKKTLKKELHAIYGGCCCYCEREERFGSAHIEHLLPKAAFPEKTFNYYNLHYSCNVCNQKKSDQYDEEYPILDACKDPVEEHLVFDRHTYSLLPKTKRGETTEDFCELNHGELLEKRDEIYKEAMDLVKDIRDQSIAFSRREYKKNKLLKRAKHGKNFCSVVRFVIKRNLDIFPGLDISSEWEFDM